MPPLASKGMGWTTCRGLSCSRFPPHGCSPSGGRKGHSSRERVKTVSLQRGEAYSGGPKMLRTPCGDPLSWRFLYMGFRPLKEDKVINTPGGSESSTPLEVRLLHHTPPEGLRSCPRMQSAPRAATVQCFSTLCSFCLDLSAPLKLF